MRRPHWFRASPSEHAVARQQSCTRTPPRASSPDHEIETDRLAAASAPLAGVNVRPPRCPSTPTPQSRWRTSCRWSHLDHSRARSCRSTPRHAPSSLPPLIACARLSAATACFRDRASVTRLSLAPPRSGMTPQLLVNPRRPSAAAAEPAVAPRDRDLGCGFCLGVPWRAGAAGASIAL